MLKFIYCLSLIQLSNVKLMERHSLYIDHQLVSRLIRQLEDIVQICHQQLDGQYQTYELRNSVYEDFVFEITNIFQNKYDFKSENLDVKIKDQDQLKKFYQLTAKLQGIKSDLKLDDLPSVGPINHYKKGRPSKNKKAEQDLVLWVKNKVQSQGRLKFPKKQIDQIFNQFLGKLSKKANPIGNYLRLFKRNNILNISIITRQGIEKKVEQFDLKENNLDSSQCKKESNGQSLIKSQFIQCQIGSNEDYSQNDDSEFYNTSQISEEEVKPKKSRMKNLVNHKKIVQTTKLSNKFPEWGADVQDDMIQWDNVLDVSNDSLKIKKAEIYENSASFD